MKTTRSRGLLALAALAVLLPGCSNHTADTEADVFLSADMRQGIVDVDISQAFDLGIPQLIIESHYKSPTPGTISAQQDTYLNHWVVTSIRTDGGTKASPVWHNYLPVYVPAGGQASLQNFRIFPSDYFRIAPLNQLFPENGGFDQETSQRNIRQRLRIEIFGKTVAGREISVTFDINVNFFYVTP
jgi:hypothetical protein